MVSVKWVTRLDKVFFSRFLQQSAALTYKNLLVAWRSRRATILRLLAPAIFLLLALVIQLALDANSRREQRIKAVEVSESEAIPSIPDCHQDVFIAGKQCVTFLYSPNTSPVVQDIIQGIKTSNTPPITDDKVLGFESRTAAEDYMLLHPESTLGAVHFDVNSSTAAFPAGSNQGINYVIQTNNTVKSFKGSFQSSVTFFTMPFMSAVARETAKVQLTRANKSIDLVWEPKLIKFPHPQLRSIGMVGYVLGPFIFAACMFGMVTQLGNIVGEKESGLVTSLRHMGLLQSSYWSSWIISDILMALATALSIVMWGNIMQFRFFLRNDSGLLVAVFWLFAMALSSFAYFLSVFMARAQSAVYLGFVVFLVGWICQTIVLFGLPYEPSYYFNPNNVAKGFFWVFAFLPWCPLVKATTDFGKATNGEKDPGLRWSERESYCQYIPDAADQPFHDPTKSFVDFDCIYPISQCLITLLIQAIGWLALAIYLDNVLPTGHGKMRPPWYFLLPSYWFNSKASTARQLRKTNSLASSTSSHNERDSWSGGNMATLTNEQQQLQQTELIPGGSAAFHVRTEDLQCSVTSVGGAADTVTPIKAAAVGQEDDDVAAEAARMHALLKYRAAGMSRTAKASPDMQALQRTAASAANLNSTTNAADLSVRYAIEVYGLSKVFRAGGCKLLACGGNSGNVTHNSKSAKNQASAGGAADFWAIKDSWFGIEEGQLFCLLGPNGAGKTTTINCLTGILPPSGGDVLVCGESISTEGSLDRIRPQVGVCPQFDVLWGELTGMEHLMVAGHVKGLPFSQVSQHASDLLERVRLLSAAGVRSASYSGGMKRRLSVALALLGNPRVLYLDEPTTGMDPISRRYVWDVIQAAKPGRAIVLTTHSMEEADILGDRIAIMARGKLKAIGSSIRLKQKFGAGYQVTATMRDVNTLRQQPSSSKPATRQAQSAEACNNAAGASFQQQQAAAAAAKQAVKALFAEHLSGLAPSEEGKRQLRYLVPRHQEQQLVALLQVMEQAIAASQNAASSSTAVHSQQGNLAGVADVQLSLTSLEEVFLNIAKQAELEEAALTGLRMTVQLPNSNKQVLIGVGQDWIEVDEALLQGSRTIIDAAGAGHRTNGSEKRCYTVKWVQDDSGALAVLEVVPVLSKSDSSSSSGLGLTPVAD